MVATMPATTGLASPRSSTISGGGKTSVRRVGKSQGRKNSSAKVQQQNDDVVKKRALTVCRWRYEGLPRGGQNDTLMD